MENDIYSRKYDYDDLKIAVVIADRFNCFNVSVDYETIANLTVTIRECWETAQKCGFLTEQEYAYIQHYANNYLDKYEDEIMEELK